MAPRGIWISGRVTKPFHGSDRTDKCSHVNVISRFLTQSVEKLQSAYPGSHGNDINVDDLQENGFLSFDLLSPSSMWKKNILVNQRIPERTNSHRGAAFFQSIVLSFLSFKKMASSFREIVTRIWINNTLSDSSFLFPNLT